VQVNRPHYVFRPRQLLRRTAQFFHEPAETAVVQLPWGLDLNVKLGDSQGRALFHNGVGELAVSEILLRLAEPGETLVDAGANIGYMTSLLAVGTGTGGRVIAAEPHPELCRRLNENISGWARVAPITVYEAALSDRNGVGELHVPKDFAHNAGLSTLESVAGSEAIRIKLRRLDSVVDGAIGVLKLDVEGHELTVLRGAESMLAEQAIRDIVYEDHDGYPTPVSEKLEAYGYRVFGLEQRLLGPRLVSPSLLRLHPFGAPPNFVATVAPDRATSLTDAWGWRALRSRGC
jgi:FkbM family methyltransferase